MVVPLIAVIDYQFKSCILCKSAGLWRLSSGGVKEQTGIKSTTRKCLPPLIFTYFIVNRTAKNSGLNFSFSGQRLDIFVQFILWNSHAFG